MPLFPLTFFPVCYSILKRSKKKRGVAQLVAHVVWDHGVGSSSLFTPTKRKPSDVFKGL